MPEMKDEILIAGHGGQGIVVAGSLIANSAVSEGLYVCGMFSYGVEIRGGTANSTIIVSDEKIGSPVVVNPKTALIMNTPSLERFEKDVEKGGLIILNVSECKKKVSRKDVGVIEIPATKIADELGNKKTANMVMVGAYIKNRGTIKIQSAVENVRRVLPKAEIEVVKINERALLKGYGK